MIEPVILTRPWIRRFPSRVWHLVESSIEDRQVTRCGRQMHEAIASGNDLYWAVQPFGGKICAYCRRPGDAIRDTEDTRV
jgi:hypothetical protein